MKENALADLKIVNGARHDDIHKFSEYREYIIQSLTGSGLGRDKSLVDTWYFNGLCELARHP